MLWIHGLVFPSFLCFSLCEYISSANFLEDISKASEGDTNNMVPILFLSNQVNPEQASENSRH